MQKFTKKILKILSKPEQRAGLTLLELMVSLGIMSLGVVAALSFFLRSQTDVQEHLYRQVMRKIAKTLERAAQDPEVIAFSALSDGQNSPLRDCIFTDASIQARKGGALTLAPTPSTLAKTSSSSSLCTATDPEKQTPIKLYRPPRDWSTAVLAQQALAGSDQDPLWYDVDGKPGCDPLGDPQCIFTVKAYFWAQCPRGASLIKNHMVTASIFEDSPATSCDRAQTINIRYQVSHSGAIGPKKKLRSRLPSIPKDSVFWQNTQPRSHSTYAAFPIAASHIGLHADFGGLCKTNYTLIALTDGNPTCKCLPPYQEENAGSNAATCSLRQHHCSPTERYMGTSLDGTPVCKPVRCVTSTLVAKGFDSQSQPGGQSQTTETLEAYCGPYGWINKIALPNNPQGNCLCVPTKKERKRSSHLWTYECQLQCSMTLTCCYEQ